VSASPSAKQDSVPRLGAELCCGAALRPSVQRRRYRSQVFGLVVCVGWTEGRSAGSAASFCSPAGGTESCFADGAPTQEQLPPRPRAERNAATRTGLNIVVLDPAAWGDGFGGARNGGNSRERHCARICGAGSYGTGGAGIQVVQTRQGNANPSFDDRSAMANAQRGAIFITVPTCVDGHSGDGARLCDE